MVRGRTAKLPVEFSGSGYQTGAVGVASDSTFIALRFTLKPVDAIRTTVRFPAKSLATLPTRRRLKLVEPTSRGTMTPTVTIHQMMDHLPTLSIVGFSGSLGCVGHLHGDLVTEGTLNLDHLPDFKGGGFAVVTDHLAPAYAVDRSTFIASRADVVVGVIGCHTYGRISRYRLDTWETHLFHVPRVTRSSRKEPR